MHYLRAQARPLGQHALLEPVDGTCDERPPLRLRDLFEQRPQPRCRLQAPEQLPTRGRMEERPQREAEASVHGAEIPHGRVVELGPALPAAHLLEQPHVVAVERRPRGEGPRHRQAGIERSDVRDRGLFEVERALVLAAVRDLEHGARAAVVQEKGLVALASEIGGAPVQAEHIRGDPRRLVRREAGRGRFQDGAHAWRC